MASFLLRSLLLCGCLTITPAVKADLIFSDNFSNNSPSLNQPVPLGWSIANSGSIDILGQCDSKILSDWLPKNNCYVDLDGGSSVNGLLKKDLFLPTGHTYTAFFDLAGNQDYPFLDIVRVTFGGSTLELEIDPFDEFKTYNIKFTPSTSSLYSLSFINSNIDDRGALLDNVRINQVPSPLPLFGAGAVAGWSRQLRRRLATYRP